MKLLLDAWFEKNNAQLRILDQLSGQELIAWDNSTVQHALDSGLICCEDFKRQPSAQEFLELAASLGL